LNNLVLTLSWKSSKFYTITHIAADIVTPLLAIARNSDMLRGYTSVHSFVSGFFGVDGEDISCIGIA